jgi:hypothetical protein
MQHYCCPFFALANVEHLYCTAKSRRITGVAFAIHYNWYIYWMKKWILLILFLKFSSAFSQTWDSLGRGVGAVSALTIYNNNLYVGGVFTEAGSILASDIAEWNGTNWDSLGSGIKFNHIFYTAVRSLCGYNGNLFAGGVNIVQAGAVNVIGIAQWNGISWDSLEGGFNGAVYALTVYNSELYAGGWIRYTNHNQIPYIAKWNGNSWDTLASNIGGLNGVVLTLTVYNGNLIAGGFFDSAGGNAASNIAMWNGNVWTSLGKGIAGLNCEVSALATYNGNLYVGGTFDSAGGIAATGIAVWNGISWSRVGGNMGIGQSVYALTSYDGYLYAGGYFDTICGFAANSVAYWNGTIWQALGTGMRGGAIFALVGNNNTLYAGGQFDSAGGIVASNIAMYPAPPSGINETNNSVSFNIAPNPSAGIFTIQSSINIGKSLVEVYNVLGEKVFKEIRRLADDNLINLTGEPNGIYLYRVLNTDGGLLGEGKLVIQK